MGLSKVFHRDERVLFRYLTERAFVSDRSMHEFPGAVHQLLLERPSVRTEATERTVKWIAERTMNAGGNIT